MNKQGLIEYLQSLPDDVVFLVSSDEEGNQLREASVGDPPEKAYQEDGEWFTVHPDDLEDYCDDALANVVVFW
jgi:hypothetical protein